MTFDKDKIKQSLNINQIFNLVESLGGEPQMKENCFISRTICHNPPHEGSYKLYYYDNTQLFKCYTECEEDGGFDIYQLIMKIQNVELTAAIYYVINFFNIQLEIKDFQKINTNLQDWNYLNKFQTKQLDFAKQNYYLKDYKKDILKYIPHPRIPSWEQEGIKFEIMQNRGVGYDPKNEGVIIPHYDINNNLIGIRERTLIQEEEIFGKYKPAIFNGILYNHPLSFSLYNLNNTKENIKKVKKAILFESEKATMQYASCFSENNDISVAVCGNNLTQYQVNLLLNLNVQEIVIAFDKQFKQLNDNEHKQWCKKLRQIYYKYNNLIQISFILDKDNLLDYKMSPIDKGGNTFLQLYNKRIFL